MRPRRPRRRPARGRGPPRTPAAHQADPRPGSRRAAFLGLEGHGRADERAEQRVRPGGTRLELWVGLGGHEERVQAAVQLDELDQPPVRGLAADVQPGRLEPLPVGVVDLVAVPVPLGHRRAAVGLGDERAGRRATAGYAPRRMVPPMSLRCRRRCRPGRHRRDHRVGASGSNSVEFALEPAEVTGHVDRHALQPEAEPERRDAVLPGVPGGADLALDAAYRRSRPG